MCVPVGVGAAFARAQGREEARLGLPVTAMPNCDAAVYALPKDQIGFLTFVVQPAFSALDLFLGDQVFGSPPCAFVVQPAFSSLDLFLGDQVFGSPPL